MWILNTLCIELWVLTVFSNKANPIAGKVWSVCLKQNHFNNSKGAQISPSNSVNSWANDGAFSSLAIIQKF